MPDVEYKAGLDDSDVLKALIRIEKAVRETAKTANEGFAKADKSAARMGTSIGAVTGVVTALSTEFINLASRAVDAFVNIAAEAVELNKEAELTRISVSNIFGGNEKVADAFLKRVKETSRLLGANTQELQSLAKGVLPDIGDTDTTLEFVKNITILGRDAGQSLQSIRIAAEEALGGNLSSLVRRLNIPPDVIDNINKYAENMSLAEAVTKALGERVKATGLSAEDTVNTLAVVQGNLEGQIQDLQKIFGGPLADELKEQFLAIGEALSANGPELEDAAIALGDMAAQAIELIGSGIVDFIENVDAQAVQEFADKMSDALASVQLLLSVIDAPEAFNSLISGATKLLDALERALFTSAQLATLAKSGLAGVEAATKRRIELGILDQRGRLQRAATEAEAIEIEKAAEDARRAVIEESLVAFEKHSEEIEENRQQTKDRTKVVEEATDAEIKLAEAQLRAAKIAGDLAEAREDAANKQADIQGKLRQDAAASLRRLTELEIRQGEARTEAAIRQAEDRIQAERDTAREREAIIFKFNQQIDRLDVNADIAKIARDNARERAEVDRDLANERISIERNFQQELRRIQQSFEQSATEAAINVDAQAFARAKRQRDNDVEAAKVNRTDQIEDAKLAAQQQREALKVELANEIADAREAHRQKVEDLKQRLEDELAAQAFKAEQDRQRQAEIDAQEDARLARQQALELERFERQEAEKQIRLEQSLQKQVNALVEAKKKEIDLLKQAEKTKADIQINEAQRAINTISRLRSRTPFARPTPTQSALNALPIIARQNGGPVAAGRSYLVGEAGPELFRPATSGRIIPNSSIVNNTVNAGFDPGGLSNPETALMVENMIRRVMVEELR